LNEPRDSGMGRFVRVALARVEAGFEFAFGPQWNPLHHLGALGWFFYWVVAVSGIYLYVFFDTGITEAYDSIEVITHVQWYAGGVMRSLHRYASDALVLIVAVHILREYIEGRLRSVRWFTWVTGVPLLWLLYASGISGYWLVWDTLAQYVAISTTEWLDALGIFGEPIARNFLDPTTLSGRFFTLLVFIHIAVPLMLLLGMWIHIHRMSLPRMNPPKGLALGTLGMLIVVSFARPALSQAPADLGATASHIGLDWFYLLLYPLLDYMPGDWLWLGLAAGTAVLAAMPWILPRKRPSAAEVSFDNCNGCGRCVADCPFTAVSLVPRADESQYTVVAEVTPELCTSCGICVGACPTATPFRRASALVSGIDLPSQSVLERREQVEAAGESLGKDKGRILVFGCARGPSADSLGADVQMLTLPCIGNLPPSFIDFVLSRGHADGVMLTGCAEADCYHRLGIRWTKARIAGERDPYLRKRVPRERVRMGWFGAAGGDHLSREVAAFRDGLRRMDE
jgi:quinol-cytochrome oxidoreductase complex cytochrome b subunit/coenzyme F420-reducing hydrogenase delta subunit